MNKLQLLKSFNQPDDKLLFSKALEQAFLCTNKHMLTFTEFLDPVKREKFKKLIEENLAVKVDSFGGALGCERQMLCFVPEYGQVTSQDYLIKAVEIKFNGKFSGGLAHRDFLGSILGCGIDRSRAGDIFIFQESAVVFLHQDVADYLVMNLTKIKHSGVHGKIIDSEYVFPPLKEFEESIITLASLRLDGLLSSVFKISRLQASKLIAADKALINWTTFRSPDKQLSEGDTITLRGYGRVKIVEIIGRSKKDKIIIKIHKTR